MMKSLGTLGHLAAARDRVLTAPAASLLVLLTAVCIPTTAAPATAACTPGADLDGVQVATPSVKVRGWSVAERQVERKGAGKVRVRVRMQGTVKARAKYRATGTVQKCDGGGAKTVTLEETVGVAYPKAVAASEVRTSSRSAAKAAKSAAKDKVRARGTRSAKRAVTSAAREDAKARLLAKAGVTPVTVAPDISQFASKVFALINKARSENMGTWGGQPVALSPLKYVSQIEPAANTWADTMVHGSFDHDPGVQAQGDAIGCNPSPTGSHWWTEAILRADYSANPTSTWPTVDQMAAGTVNAWMNSPAHRAILLSYPATYAGVGSVFKDGVWTVVLRTTSSNCSNIAGY